MANEILDAEDTDANVLLESLESTEIQIRDTATLLPDMPAVRPPRKALQPTSGNVRRTSNSLICSFDRSNADSSPPKKKKRGLHSSYSRSKRARHIQILDETDIDVPDQGVPARSRLGMTDRLALGRRVEMERLKLQLQAIRVKQRLLELENEDVSL